MAITDVPACLVVSADLVLSDALDACVVSETQPTANYGHAAQSCPGKLIADLTNTQSTPLTPYIQWLPDALPQSFDSTECTGLRLDLDAYGWNGTQWILRETILVQGSFANNVCTPVVTYSGPVVSGGVPAAITGYSSLRIVAGGSLIPGLTTARSAIPIRVGFKANPGSPPSLSCMTSSSANCAAPSGNCVRAFGRDAPQLRRLTDFGKPAGGGVDRKSDILLLGGAANRLPIALSNGDGTFAVPSSSGYFVVASYYTAAGNKVVGGDFNGDGSMDVLWSNNTASLSISVAASNGANAQFQSGSNYWASDFVTWANAAGAQAIAGDFNGDGKSDIALTGQLTTIPVAFSTGGGFNVTNQVMNYPLYTFPALARQAGAKAVAGDFDGDGKSDIAIVGGPSDTIPIAYSFGNGTFRLGATQDATIANLARSAGVKPVEGDFDGDGRSDIALPGGAGSSIPVLFSRGNATGLFTLTNVASPQCATWASTAGAKPVSGDFNNDGKDDIAWVGVAWSSIPIAYSQGSSGAFSCPALVTDAAAAAFLQMSVPASIKPLRLVAGY